ncbi:hypothetical protein CRE_07581 [Caenorhabditis remanei]|uniref:Uncharacterized protein n=1 Tax=Caenorhabditis remanei TaxID=31234 RepID=E3MP42_CAERE|nr:hypothetical protein CRE_07581 [Caenorhabditis remanei]
MVAFIGDNHMLKSRPEVSAKELLNVSSNDAPFSSVVAEIYILCSEAGVECKAKFGKIIDIIPIKKICKDVIQYQ